MSEPRAHLAFCVPISDEVWDERFEDEPLDWDDVLAAYLGVPHPAEPWSESRANVYLDYWAAKREVLRDAGCTIERDGSEDCYTRYLAVRCINADWETATPVTPDMLATTDVDVKGVETTRSQEGTFPGE